ncbi:hypothetical protein VNO78_05791 [Psophocarpus tetragonolobus]|uniref:AT-hook motif nuclear-localized protein n=1 Tax=Psophocarpus tetragonolobus TaxID=3891 RepID=A0AAN9XR07_PSOTE
MEQQNPTDTDKFLSLGPTANEPNTPKEAVDHANADSNVVNVGSGWELAVTVAKSDAAGSGQLAKRGRGRPRKYDAVGSAVSPATATVPPGFSDQTVKRGRGRPRGSGKLQILASLGGCMAETAGGSFIPHVLTVNIGEDLVSTIMSFYDKGPRAVCVLSATGSLSSVALREHSISNVVTRYEGTFEILSLTGSCAYISSPTGLIRKTSKLTASLAKGNGMVFGGVLESALASVCPIQLIIATFKQSTNYQIKRKQMFEYCNASLTSGNSDLERDQVKVPKMTDGEKSCPSPPTTTITNVAVNNSFPATSNGVIDSVIPPDNNGDSIPINDDDLDSQALHFASDDSDQRTSADINANVTKI